MRNTVHIHKDGVSVFCEAHKDPLRILCFHPCREGPTSKNTKNISDTTILMIIAWRSVLFLWMGILFTIFHTLVHGEVFGLHPEGKSSTILLFDSLPDDPVNQLFIPAGIGKKSRKPQWPP